MKKRAKGGKTNIRTDTVYLSPRSRLWGKHVFVHIPPTAWKFSFAKLSLSINWRGFPKHFSDDPNNREDHSQLPPPPTSSAFVLTVGPWDQGAGLDLNSSPVFCQWQWRPDSPRVKKCFLPYSWSLAKRVGVDSVLLVVAAKSDAKQLSTFLPCLGFQSSRPDREAKIITDSLRESRVLRWRKFLLPRRKQDCEAWKLTPKKSLDSNMQISLSKLRVIKIDGVLYKEWGEVNC